MKAKIGGFLHLAVGEEATVVGTTSALRPEDYLMSTYREHGQALARGTDPKAVMAELFGREGGVSRGRGGSMHLYDAERRFLGGYGIVGGNLPLAAGVALASDYRGEDDGLATSPAVVGALVQLFESDYRSGLRTVVEGGNPQFSAEEVHQRVDDVFVYSPLEATLGRLRGWISHDSREAGRALGDRLWMLTFGGNLWFPAELKAAFERDVPEARIEEVADGAVSRPDQTAEIVRRITRC